MQVSDVTLGTPSLHAQCIERGGGEGGGVWSRGAQQQYFLHRTLSYFWSQRLRLVYTQFVLLS